VNNLTRVIAITALALGLAGETHGQVINLLVGNQSGFPGLDRYAATNGLYQGVFASASGGSHFSYFKYGGPSNNLFVLQDSTVLQFDGHTGNFVSSFITYREI
jgi:hypothetical protein